MMAPNAPTIGAISPFVLIERAARWSHSPPVRVALALCLGATLPAPMHAQGDGTSLTFAAHTALDTGSPFSVIQTLSLRTVEITWAVNVHPGSAWTVRLPVSVVPMAVMLHNPNSTMSFSNARWWLDPASGRSTSLGAGIKPVGARVSRSLGPMALEVGVGAGLIYFDRPTPGANSERLNALLDADLALQFPVRGRLAAIVGYRLSHISNVGRGNVNPGVDSHMLSVGVRR